MNRFIFSTEARKSSVLLLRWIVVCFMLSVVGLPLFSQTSKDRKRFTLIELNVENAFDTLHDKGKADEEYLPDGAKAWNSARYWTKLDRLQRELVACFHVVPADLIALCEVENENVMEDLTKKMRFHRFGYEYVMTQSQDSRGIDVALLYQPLSFLPVSQDILRIVPPKGKHPTRDVLHVAGMIPTGDTLDVFVCHFPSNWSDRSGKYRQQVAKEVRRAADSIQVARQKPAIIITGDLNDTENSATLRIGLRTERHRNNFCATSFYNLCEEVRNGEISGTYFFQHHWHKLDHIIVNGTLLSPSSTLFTDFSQCTICAPDFLLEINTQGQKVPKRFFKGPLYHGGFSDHLPVRLDFWY